MNLSIVKHEHKVILEDENSGQLYQFYTISDEKTNHFDHCAWEICDYMDENGAVWSEVTDENLLNELDKSVYK